MQNIGLMMTCNEDDIIEEVMIANRKYFDTILVLDGSTDNTETIIRSFDNVKYFLKDQDIVPKRKIKDGVRQFLLEKAQEMFGTEGWFTLLHGDEVMVDDPNIIAYRAEKVRAEKVNWHALNFFLHQSQENDPDLFSKPVTQRCVHYMPGGLEIRQFKNKPGICFDLNQSHLVPHGINKRILFDFPIFKHYVIRSVEQMERNAQVQDRMVTKSTPKSRSALFFNGPSPTYKQFRKYDGDFKEFEPGKRPPFFFQWLNFHKYRKVF